MRLTRLDGIRGIAILLTVMTHHFIFPKTGWIGVELFFVLSGFLITRILRGTRKDHHYWASFYAKRCARIAPPLLLVLATAAVLAPHIPWKGFAAYALFFGDVADARHSYYLGALSPLWSLAVEEHYYLVWPVLVRAMSYRRLVITACGILLLAPFARFLIGPHTVEGTIYFLTPFRLDSIALGSLLALLCEHQPAVALLERISGYGAAIFTGAYFLTAWTVPTFDRRADSPVFNLIGYSLVAVSCFFVVAWTLHLKEGSRAERALSWSPLVYMGRVSYSMYLFQPIITSAVRTLLHIPAGGKGIRSEWALMPLNLALTVALAAVIYRFVETPSIAAGSRFVKSLGERHSEQGIIAETPLSRTTEAEIGGFGREAA